MTLSIMTLSIMAVSFMLSVIYAECYLCWVLFMLSVIYAECYLCWVLFMLSVIYAECYWCWVLLILSVIDAECYLCWVLFMLSIKEWVTPGMGVGWKKYKEVTCTEPSLSIRVRASEESAREGPHFRLHPIVCGGDVWSWQPPTFYNIGSWFGFALH